MSASPRSDSPPPIERDASPAPARSESPIPRSRSRSRTPVKWAYNPVELVFDLVIDRIVARYSNAATTATALAHVVFDAQERCGGKFEHL